MNQGRALAIFENIENAKENENEKALAIRIVLDMETHNSVKKSSMLKVIEYLWSHLYCMERGERMSNEQDTIYRQAAIEVIDAAFPVDPMQSEYAQGIACGVALAKTYVEQLPSAQPERQVELDGTESNIEILSELRAQFNCFDEVEEPVYRALSDAIYALSVQPERKTGEWQEKTVNDEVLIEEWQSAQCSVCGKYHTTPYMYYFDNFNYCPNCGSYNRGDNNEAN